MGARSLVGPSSMSGGMSPSWLMQMQSQMAQAQLMQAQMRQSQALQAQALQGQQMLLANSFNPAFNPALQGSGQQPEVKQTTRIKAKSKPLGAPRSEVKVQDRSPPKPADLAADLVHASDEQQEQALDCLRDGKGAEYTDCLAHAIAKLDGEARARARDALVERLARMNAATLRDKLADGDFEIRRAAVLAWAMKEDRQFVPDLIGLMAEDSSLLPAVRTALRSLTEVDFGPSVSAGTESRRAAIAAWKAWWQTQQ